MWTQAQERRDANEWLRLTFALSVLLFNAVALAQTFTPASAPPQNWLSIASSADGTKLAAVGSYGWLYLSTNSGATWSPATTVTNGTEPTRAWTGITCSSDGSNYVAVANFSSIFTSTDSGLNWVSHGPALSWNAVASSANGVKLIAADYDMGRLYTSVDSGVTWTVTSSAAKRWRSLASSADGTKLVAGTDYGTNYNDVPSIYTSTDSGASWKLTSAPHQPWQALASSADGSKLAAGVYGGLIYLSGDSGNTWNAANVPSARWGGIASSADGSRLAAAAWEGFIYVSSDAGNTWLKANAPTQQWQTVASSADGIKIAAGIYDLSTGGIYTAMAAPFLNISISANSATLSWPASASGFTLQQNPDPSQPTWTDVGSGNVVSTDNQIVIPRTSSRLFFRLVHR
jgi:photosystem II stability/assembly factor-like uncharacterized protein